MPLLEFDQEEDVVVCRATRFAEKRPRASLEPATDGWAITRHPPFGRWRYAERLTSFPPADVPDELLLASLSPSLSDEPFTPACAAGGGPGGGLMIMAWVMPLFTAPIVLIVSSPGRNDGLKAVGSMTRKG